jgi:ParB-like chromosome segregation protein Spo0J
MGSKSQVAEVSGNKAAAEEVFNSKTKNLAAKPHTTNQLVPLSLISVTYNVRNVFPVLDQMGHSYIDLIRMAISKDKAEREKFCTLVEEHEAFRKDKEEEQTFLELAESIFDLGQVEAIQARQLGTTTNKDPETKDQYEKKYGYSIVAGGRRTAALAYLHAKGYIHTAHVKAELVRGTPQELFDISVAENLQRRDFSPQELAKIAVRYKDEYEMPDGTKGMSWEDVSKRMHRSIPTIKGYYCLVKPVDGVDSAALLQKLERKEITKTEAVAVASGKTAPMSIGDGKTRLTGRAARKSLPVSAIEKLIDETPHDGKPSSVARIKAFAEVLGSTYEVEMKSSEERLKQDKGKTA